MYVDETMLDEWQAVLQRMLSIGISPVPCKVEPISEGRQWNFDRILEVYWLFLKENNRQTENSQFILYTIFTFSLTGNK